MLHRDLKSSNIFLSTDDQVKLGDFGTAKNLANTTQCLHGLVGTPLYMPPEIINSRPYSYKADVWSLGVVFYELMALKPPFEDYTYHALLAKICNAPITPLPEVFSAELRDFVMRILERDEAKRPSIHDLFASSFLRKELERQPQFNYSNLSSSRFHDLEITDIQLKSEFEQLKTYRFSEFVSPSMMTGQKSKNLLQLANQNMAGPSRFGSTCNNQILSLSSSGNTDQVFYESFINQSNLIGGDLKASELLNESPMSHLIDQNNKMMDSDFESTRKATTLQSSKPFSGFQNAQGLIFSDFDDKSNVLLQRNSECQKSINLRISLSGLQMKAISLVTPKSNSTRGHFGKTGGTENSYFDKTEESYRLQHSPRASFRPISLLDSEVENDNSTQSRPEDSISGKRKITPARENSLISPQTSHAFESMDIIKVLTSQGLNTKPEKIKRLTSSSSNVYRNLKRQQLSLRIAPKQATLIKPKDFSRKESDKQLSNSHQRQASHFNQSNVLTARSKFAQKMLTRVKSAKNDLRSNYPHPQVGSTKLVSSLQMTPVHTNHLKNIRFIPLQSFFPFKNAKKRTESNEQNSVSACDYCGSPCPVNGHEATEKQTHQQLLLNRAESLRKKCTDRFQGKFESIYSAAKRFVIHQGLKTIQQAITSPVQLLRMAAGFDSQLQSSPKHREALTDVIKICVLEFQSANCNYAN